MAEKDTLYARWLENKLSESEIKQLEESGELEELKAIVAGTEKLELPYFDQERVYQEIKLTKGSKSNSRWNWRHYSGLAASILLIFSIYFLLQGSTQTINVGNGETLAYTFQDNSAVELNDGSKISFDYDEWETIREVELEGEAFFSVEKGLPFKVETCHGIVEVLGTKFNIRSWENDLSAIACYEGSVRVSYEGESVVLSAAEKVKIIDGKILSKEVMEEKQPSWMLGFSRFEKEKIKEVLKEVERQYNVEIEMPRVDQFFTGSFTHQDLREAMDQICTPMGLKYTISQDAKRLKVSK